MASKTYPCLLSPLSTCLQKDILSQQSDHADNLMAHLALMSAWRMHLVRSSHSNLSLHYFSNITLTTALGRLGSFVIMSTRG